MYWTQNPGISKRGGLRGVDYVNVAANGNLDVEIDFMRAPRHQSPIHRGDRRVNIPRDRPPE